MKKRELAFWWHDEQAVRLSDCACNLGEELRSRNPDGDRKPNLFADVAPQAPRDLDRCAGYPLHAAYVEERLVDREPFYEWRRVLEHRVERLARL
jgi:hypothetical protein